MKIADARARVHELLGEIMPAALEDEPRDDELPDGGVLTGWIVIAEWQGTDGNRWLSKISGNATADKGLPCWHERGFCNEVVHHWPGSDNDEDD